MHLICEIIPRRDSDTHDLQELGRALKTWQEAVLPSRGLKGRIVQSGLDDLLSGELPTPAGIIIANGARSLLQQKNLDAAIRAFLMQLASQNWDAVHLDAEALQRRAVCGIVTLSDGDESAQPDIEQVLEAYESLQETLPPELVESVGLRKIVKDTDLNRQARNWKEEEEEEEEEDHGFTD